MDVSVVIVSWNTRQILYNCLKSIEKYTKNISYEIIVVDNNSSDGTCEMIKKEFPDVQLIESKENLGFSKGNNMAINRITGEYTFLLNPDTLIDYDVIYNLYIYMKKNEKIGVLGPRLLNEDRTFQTSYANFPSIKEMIRYNIANVLKIPFILTNKLENIDNIKISSKEVDCIRGAAMLISTSLFKQIGGFDEGYFMYCEDTDLCYRIKKMGYKIFFNSDEYITHLYNQSGKQLNMFRENNIIKSTNLFLKNSKGSMYCRLYMLNRVISSLFLGTWYFIFSFNRKCRDISKNNFSILKQFILIYRSKQ